MRSLRQGLLRALEGDESPGVDRADVPQRDADGLGDHRVGIAEQSFGEPEEVGARGLVAAPHERERCGHRRAATQRVG